MKGEKSQWWEFRNSFEGSIQASLLPAMCVLPEAASMAKAGPTTVAFLEMEVWDITWDFQLIWGDVNLYSSCGQKEVEKADVPGKRSETDLLNEVEMKNQ